MLVMEKCWVLTGLKFTESNKSLRISHTPKTHNEVVFVIRVEGLAVSDTNEVIDVIPRAAMHHLAGSRCGAGWVRWTGIWVIGGVIIICVPVIYPLVDISSHIHRAVEAGGDLS